METKQQLKCVRDGFIMLLLLCSVGLLLAPNLAQAEDAPEESPALTQPSANGDEEQAMQIPDNGPKAQDGEPEKLKAAVNKQLTYTGRSPLPQHDSIKPRKSLKELQETHEAKEDNVKIFRWKGSATKINLSKNRADAERKKGFSMWNLYLASTFIILFFLLRYCFLRKNSCFTMGLAFLCLLAGVAMMVNLVVDLF